MYILNDQLINKFILNKIQNNLFLLIVLMLSTDY